MLPACLNRGRICYCPKTLQDDTFKDLRLNGSLLLRCSWGQSLRSGCHITKSTAADTALAFAAVKSSSQGLKSWAKSGSLPPLPRWDAAGNRVPCPSACASCPAHWSAETCAQQARKATTFINVPRQKQILTAAAERHVLLLLPSLTIVKVTVGTVKCKAPTQTQCSCYDYQRCLQHEWTCLESFCLPWCFVDFLSTSASIPNCVELRLHSIQAGNSCDMRCPPCWMPFVASSFCLCMSTGRFPEES